MECRLRPSGIISVTPDHEPTPVHTSSCSTLPDPLVDMFNRKEIGVAGERHGRGGIHTRHGRAGGGTLSSSPGVLTLALTSGCPLVHT